MITISSDEEEDGEESVIPQPQSQSSAAAPRAAQSKDRPIFHTTSPPSPVLFSDSEDEEQQHVERLRLPQEITTPSGSRTVGGCHVDIYKTSDSHVVLPSGGDPSNHHFRKSQMPQTFLKSSPFTPDYGSAATRTSHAMVTLSTGLPPVSSPLGSYAEAHTQSQIRVSLSAESPHAPIGDTDIHSQESAGIPTFPSQVSSQPHHQHCGPQIAQVYGNIGTGSRGDIQMLAGQSLNFSHTGHNFSPQTPQVFTSEDSDENQNEVVVLNSGQIPAPQEAVVPVRDSEVSTDSPMIMSRELPSQSIWLGSYRGIPSGPVLISSSGIIMEMKSPEGDSVEIHIEVNDIICCIAHLGSQLSALLVYTSPRSSKWIRQILSMDGSSGGYYNPASKDESHKRMIIFLDEVTELDQSMIPMIFESMERRQINRNKRLVPILVTKTYEQMQALLDLSSPRKYPATSNTHQNNNLIDKKRLSQDNCVTTLPHEKKVRRNCFENKESLPRGENALPSTSRTSSPDITNSQVGVESNLGCLRLPVLKPVTPSPSTTTVDIDPSPPHPVDIIEVNSQVESPSNPGMNLPVQRPPLLAHASPTNNTDTLPLNPRTPLSYFEHSELENQSNQDFVIERAISPNDGVETATMVPPRDSVIMATGVSDSDDEHLISGEEEEEEEREVFSGPVVKMFTYPPPPSPRGITVTNEDLFCLREGQCLNDVIIDFYLTFLVRYCLGDENRRRTHIFSTFFFTKLKQLPDPVRPCDSHLSPQELRHHNVKSWTKNIDIFSKDFIIVPINECAHWYLAVICFPGLAGLEEASNTNQEDASIAIEKDKSPSRILSMHDAIQGLINFWGKPGSSADSPGGAERGAGNTGADGEKGKGERDPGKQPCILIFDSFGGSSITNINEVLREYLQVEWDLKKKATEGARVFNEDTLKADLPEVPQQTNFSDCGIYLLLFVESFFECPIRDFTLPLRSLMNWFPTEEAKLMRESLTALIEELQEQIEEAIRQDNDALTLVENEKG